MKQRKKSHSKIGSELLNNMNAEQEFRIHTPAFLSEVFDNNPRLGATLRIPANTLRLYLIQIATRASELNDPKLNAIMCQMALYEIADPYSNEYDAKKTKQIISKKYDNRNNK
jgi:hypothetical protein